MDRSPLAPINTKDLKLNLAIIAYPILNLQFMTIRRNHQVKKSVQGIRWLPVVGSRSSKALRRGRILLQSIRVKFSIVSRRMCQRLRARISTKLSNLDAILAIAKMLSNLKNAQFSER